MFEVLDDVDTGYLDELLLDRGLVRPVRWKKLRCVPQAHLKVWCVRQGVYQLPTCELIDWLKEAIAGRTAIEICAGRSCLGRSLGIPMSDSYLHLHPDMHRMYQILKQTPTQPPGDVERLTANEAVAKYKPQVVIGRLGDSIWDRGTGSNESLRDERGRNPGRRLHLHSHREHRGTRQETNLGASAP